MIMSYTQWKDATTIKPAIDENYLLSDSQLLISNPVGYRNKEMAQTIATSVMYIVAQLQDEANQEKYDYKYEFPFGVTYTPTNLLNTLILPGLDNITPNPFTRFNEFSTREAFKQFILSAMKHNYTVDILTLNLSDMYRDQLVSRITYYKDTEFLIPSLITMKLLTQLFSVAQVTSTLTMREYGLWHFYTSVGELTRYTVRAMGNEFKDANQYSTFMRAVFKMLITYDFNEPFTPFMENCIINLLPLYSFRTMKNIII